jgi:hypothetical protein
MVQIDGPKRYVYIKFRDNNRLLDVLHLTGGEVEYRHTNGKISIVHQETAGLGMRKVRIANLPPEVPDAVIRTVLSIYGEVQGVQAETWSRAYRYTVANGIHIASITLTKHIPSHITMTENRVLVSYEGQPMTCHGCNGTGHLYQACGGEQREMQRLNRPHPGRILRQMGPEDEGKTGRSQKVGPNTSTKPSMLKLYVGTSKSFHTFLSVGYW